jgi:hypothetical protein
VRELWKTFWDFIHVERRLDNRYLFELPPGMERQAQGSGNGSRLDQFRLKYGARALIHWEGVSDMAPRPPLPPFTAETAALKARKAEDAWNSRDPEAVSLAYTEDSRWRNRAEFLQGRKEIVAFLTRRWVRELDYRLIKEVWSFKYHWPLGRRPVTIRD